MKKEKNTKISKIKKILLIVLVIFVLLIIIGLLVPEEKTELKIIAEKIGKEYDSKDIEYDVEKGQFDHTFNESALITVDSCDIYVYRYESNNEANAEYQFYKDFLDYLNEKNKEFGIIFSQKYGEIKLKYNKHGLNEDNSFVINNYLVYINGYINKGPKDTKETIKNIIEENSKGNSNGNDYKDYWEEQLTNAKEEINNSYTKSVEEKKEIIKQDIKSLETCQGNNCKDILDKILEYNVYDELKELVKTGQNKYNEVIKKKKDKATSISNKITKIEKSLNQKDYDNVKKEINNITDAYYDSYKDSWNKRLNAISVKVYKKSCKTYKYKDILRYPEKYKGKRAYYFGKIEQKVDSTQFRLGINCHKYYTMNEYYCDNTIYLTYTGSTNLIEDDMVYVWGELDGTITYTTVLGSSLTIPAIEGKYVKIK